MGDTSWWFYFIGLGLVTDIPTGYMNKEPLGRRLETPLQQTFYKLKIYSLWEFLMWGKIGESFFAYAI